MSDVVSGFSRIQNRIMGRVTKPACPRCGIMDITNIHFRAKRPEANTLVKALYLLWRGAKKLTKRVVAEAVQQRRTPR